MRMRGHEKEEQVPPAPQQHYEEGNVRNAYSRQSGHDNQQTYPSNNSNSTDQRLRPDVLSPTPVAYSQQHRTHDGQHRSQPQLQAPVYSSTTGFYHRPASDSTADSVDEDRLEHDYSPMSRFREDGNLRADTPPVRLAHKDFDCDGVPRVPSPIALPPSGMTRGDRDGSQQPYSQPYSHAQNRGGYDNPSARSLVQPQSQPQGPYQQGSPVAPPPRVAAATVPAPVPVSASTPATLVLPKLSTFGHVDPVLYGGRSKRDQLGSIAESWGADPSDANRIGLFQHEPEPGSPKFAGFDYA